MCVIPLFFKWKFPQNIKKKFSKYKEENFLKIRRSVWSIFSRHYCSDDLILKKKRKKLKDSIYSKHIQNGAVSPKTHFVNCYESKTCFSTLKRQYANDERMNVIRMRAITIWNSHFSTAVHVEVFPCTWLLCKRSYRDTRNVATGIVLVLKWNGVKNTSALFFQDEANSSITSQRHRPTFSTRINGTFLYL